MQLKELELCDLICIAFRETEDRKTVRELLEQEKQKMSNRLYSMLVKCLEDSLIDEN